MAQLLNLGVLLDSFLTMGISPPVGLTSMVQQSLRPPPWCRPLPSADVPTPRGFILEPGDLLPRQPEQRLTVCSLGFL